MAAQQGRISIIRTPITTSAWNRLTEGRWDRSFSNRTFRQSMSILTHAAITARVFEFALHNH
jgi:hypothetical protein